jgi:hypothetical protein
MEATMATTLTPPQSTEAGDGLPKHNAPKTIKHSTIIEIVVVAAILGLIFFVKMANQTAPQTVADQTGRPVAVVDDNGNIQSVAAPGNVPNVTADGTSSSCSLAAVPSSETNMQTVISRLMDLRFEGLNGNTGCLQLAWATPGAVANDAARAKPLHTSPPTWQWWTDSGGSSASPSSRPPSDFHKGPPMGVPAF